MTTMTQRVLVLHHGADEFGGRAYANVRKALDSARLAHETHDLSISSTPPELSRFSAVLTCTEKLSDLGADSAQALISFVENGGGLGVIYRGLHPSLFDLFGIVPPEQRPAFVSPDFNEQGLVFPGGALPAFAGLSLDAPHVTDHSSLDVWPTYGVEIVATTTSAMPLAWRNCVGKGRVLYWNTSLLSLKRARGLIIETLQCVQSVSVQPLANAGVIQIDDFPAPLNNTLSGEVSREYPALSGSEFYCSVWYPDMMALAQKYQLELSFFCVFDYTNRTEHPFVPWCSPELSSYRGNPKADSFAAVANQRPAELGLHGFNHLSLVSENWPDSETMVAALKAGLDAWDSNGLGPLPVSYVAPNNAFDKQGILALSEAIPSIQTIGAFYLGTSEDRGGNREFGPEPWNQNVFSLPRATSGYEGVPSTIFDAVNQIAAFGTWTHFLHADDICDTPGDHGPHSGCRNPKNMGWRDRRGKRGLHGEFERLIRLICDRFPWLNFMTTSAAGETLKHFLSSQWDVQIEDDQIRVAGEINGFFRLRLNGTPRPILLTCTGGTVLHQDTSSDLNVYVIKQTDALVEITIDRQPCTDGFLTRVWQQAKLEFGLRPKDKVSSG